MKKENQIKEIDRIIDKELNDLGINPKPWTKHQTARFLVESANDEEDYQHVKKKIKQMGLNPEEYACYKPNFL